MSEQENVRIVIGLLEKLNRRDFSVNPDLYTDDYLIEAPGAYQPMDAETYQMYLQPFFTAFPDLHFENLATISDGDRVVVAWRATGTHDGPMGLPSGDILQPTGISAITDGTTLYEFRDGKIASAKTFWDMAGLLMKLGAMKVAQRKP